MPFFLQTRQTIPLRDIASADDYFVRVNEVVLQVGTDAKASQVIDLMHETTVRLGADVSSFVTFIREDVSFASFRSCSLVIRNGASNTKPTAGMQTTPGWPTPKCTLSPFVGAD